MIRKKCTTALTVIVLFAAVLNMVEITESSSMTVYAQNAGNATSTPLTNNTGSQSNQSSQSVQPLGNLKIEHAGDFYKFAN